MHLRRACTFKYIAAPGNLLAAYQRVELLSRLARSALQPRVPVVSCVGKLHVWLRGRAPDLDPEVAGSIPVMCSVM